MVGPIRWWNGVHGKAGWKEAAGYTDWRKVFEKHGKELDVVFVATPDHTHFAPSMTAVSMGIHCYTEKPLTWSVREAQLLTAAYACARLLEIRELRRSQSQIACAPSEVVLRTWRRELEDRLDAAGSVRFG